MDTTRTLGVALKVLPKAAALFLCGLMLLVAGCGAGAGSGSSGNNIAVTITNKVASIQAGTAAITFLATVQNDSTNSGVTWSLSANGAACSPTCGTLTVATSGSVSYIPPASGPAAPNNQPMLTATSVAKANKSDSDAFTVTAALTVAITNKFTSVNTGASPFVVNATVQNDGTNSGVSWTLTANGVNCSPVCGTLSGVTTSSVTYAPPTSIPAFQPTLTAISIHDSSKADSFSFTIKKPAIIVMIQGKFNNVFAGGPTIFLEGNVINDSSSSPGVTWTLTANNVDCRPACGTLTTVGAAGVRYTSPASVPATPGYNTPTLTATSNADPSKSDSDTFTIAAAPPISVTITKTTSILATGTGFAFSAYVQNDFTNSGVIWTLTCTPSTSCGTLSVGTSTTTAVYIPPTSNPASQATITATSQANSGIFDSQTFNITSTVNNGCSGSSAGQESLLKGHYAFLVQGFWAGGSGVPNLVGASFLLDGMGGVSSGEEDLNDTISPQHLMITSGGSLYTVGSDHRGCLQLTNSGGTTSIFHFSVDGLNSGVMSKGHVIEFDNNSTNGAGGRGSGIIRLQDPNSFMLSALQSQYAFGVDGWSQNGQFSRLVGAGWFTNSGGNLSNGVDDLVFTGGVTSPDTTGLSGTINVISATTGRTTGSFDIFDWAIYVVNSSEFFVLSTDATSSGTVSMGRAVATASSFNAASLSGSYVVHATGNTNNSADVTLQLLTMTPGGAQTGTLSGSVYSYSAGSGAQTSTLNGVTYNVDPSSGRTTLGNPADNLPILYLTTPTDGIAAFVVGVGADALFGAAEPQTSLALPAGTYIFGTEDPSDNNVPNKAGVETIATGGAISGTYDQSNTSGLQSGLPLSVTLSLGSNGTGNMGPNTVAITTGSKLFSIDETGATAGPAAIVVAEQ